MTMFLYSPRHKDLHLHRFKNPSDTRADECWDFTSMKVKDFLYFISSNAWSFGISDPWLIITKCLVDGGKGKEKKTKCLSLEIPGIKTGVWVSKTAHGHLIWYLILIPLVFKWEHLIPHGKSRYQLRKTCSRHILVPPPGLCRAARCSPRPRWVWLRGAACAHRRASPNCFCRNCYIRNTSFRLLSVINAL